MENAFARISIEIRSGHAYDAAA